MHKTSWGKVAKWYSDVVGENGHYFHQHVILPRLKLLLDPQGGESVLDVGCGQGVYARTLPAQVQYLGLDLSRELITTAKQLDHDPGHQYFVADATQELPVTASSFDHALALLALQNMSDSASVIKHLSDSLKAGGDLTIVLNHPCFRIPRQSSWGVEESNKLEYRRVNRYLSPLEIPINAHPGDKSSPVTWSYHEPLDYYFRALKAAHLVVTDLAEWTSDKTSVGKAAKGENRARREFPLFLVIKAVKISI